jgi:2-hydroxy-3-oxopropionate reductase
LATIGFVGLGIMGSPMAANLVRAGHDVVGYNRSRPPVDGLVAAGGRAAGSVREGVAAAEVVITMLPDSPDVLDVALGPDGIFANATPGLLYIDCSTIRPDTARRIAGEGAERGIRVLDAPVSGGESGAVAATLSIMVGGDAADAEHARQVLEAMGSTVVHVGPCGAGQTVKAANQLIVAGTIGLVAEAIVFLEAYGVDTSAAVRVLAGGLAGNAILDRKAAGMLERQFAPGFRVDLHHKDMGIVTAAAREAGVAIPLGAQAAQLMAALRAQGYGDLDHSALLLLIEQLSGRAADGPSGSASKEM